MPQRPDLPVDGATITSSWGATVRDQIVTPFSTAGVRDGEITSGLRVNGMVSTLTASDTTNGLYVYNGVNWRPSWNLPWGLVGRAVNTGTQNLTSTSFADLSNLSASSVPLNGNRYYRATLSLWVGQPVISTTGVDATLSFRITNGAASTTYATLPDLAIKATDSQPYCATATFTASAGSVTMKAQYKVTGTGTSILTAGGSYQCELVIEDLGPSGAPSA